MTTYYGQQFDFSTAFARAAAVNASKGNTPGFPQQFRLVQENFRHTRTPEKVNVNLNPGPSIPQIFVKPPWHFDGMIPSVAFNQITDTRQTTNLKAAAFICALLGLIIIFGAKK